MENEEKELKETQGQKKIKQYIEDLLRNKHFIRLINKLKITYSNLGEGNFEEVERLIKEYKKLDKKAVKYERDYFAEFERLRTVIVEEYGLDNELMRPVMTSVSSLNDGKLKESLMYDLLDTDLCITVDNYDENLNQVYPPIPFWLDKRKRDHLKAFPISIDLHRFTTKRDLLDYIEKRWPWIENMLGTYRENKRIKFRKRKLDRKMIDFIWDRRSMGIKDIKKALDIKYPQNNLIYYEIYKLISIEKHRRNKKIIVGQ